MTSPQACSTSPQTTSRRDFIRVSGGALAAVGLAGSAPSLWAAPVEDSFSLPSLPYAYDALAPVIDTQTMMIHHTKHHQAYINNLNAAVSQESSLAGKSLGELLKHLDSIPAAVRTAVRNNGGGHANHMLFWQVMQAPREAGKPSGKLGEAIASKFGSFENFKEQFTKAALGQFGSGWAWLVVGDGGLDVVATANQDNPISSGQTPILGIDVWEHAYYLNYQNRRADYVGAWWKVVNWDQVAKFMEKAAS